MNLVQLLTLIGLFFAGLPVGYPLAALLPFLPHGLVEVICGTASVLFLAWPVYKRFGWLPQPPACPRCNESQYVVVSHQTGGVKWKCNHCGQLIVLKSESILVIDDKGEAISRLELRWPKFFGRWKPI
jgi:hypothetical protein